MHPNDLILNAVNWEHGMLLTPNHFVRQEKYFDSLVLWLLRYASNTNGLVGGGARLPEAERGAAKHDPIVSILEDDTSLTVTVSQCRGVSPDGAIIDVSPDQPVERRFLKSDLEGIVAPVVYVVRDLENKTAIGGVVDEINPQMLTERTYTYRIAMRISPAEFGAALACGQFRRQRYGSGYERNPDFIPACATMTAHSELAASYRRIVERTTFLADRYAELHSAMHEYMFLFAERGLDTEVDGQAIQFVDRIVTSLQDCIYALLDPTQSPEQFFGRLRRFFHSTAVYFDLAPGMRTYYDTLQDASETSFVQLIQEQKQIVRTTRSIVINDDLGVEIRWTLRNLATLIKLEQALEGKYLDFRISSMLEAMNFIFDRGGKSFYKLAAKPSSVRGAGGESIIVFGQLHLEGREKYRLVLVGEGGAVFENGSRVSIDIRVNESTGFQRPPLQMTSTAVRSDQINFEFDFDAPDVPVISDIRLIMPSRHPFRTALLFCRHRFYSDRSNETMSQTETDAPVQRSRFDAAPAGDSLPPLNRRRRLE